MPTPSAFGVLKTSKKGGVAFLSVSSRLSSAPTGAMSSGLRLEDSFYDFLSPGPSPLSPPGQSLGSVGDGWPPRANSPPPHGNTVTWPPGEFLHPLGSTPEGEGGTGNKKRSRLRVVCAEFRPGEPWKGYPNIDPETDPYVTPGSVINNLSINTVRDTDHLRDRNNGRLIALSRTSSTGELISIER